MYQYLIDQGKKIDIHDIKLSNIVPLGTPAEILKFDKNFSQNNK
jgi:hypothetical protein